MKNPIAVFLFSIDHKSRTLNRIFEKIGLYEVILPFPFEHYCVFCAKYVCDCWWKDREYFLKQHLEDPIRIWKNNKWYKWGGTK